MSGSPQDTVPQLLRDEADWSGRYVRCEENTEWLMFRGEMHCLGCCVVSLPEVTA